MAPDARGGEEEASCEISEELIDALADGPRHGAFNPDPQEVQSLLAEIHADDGIPYSYEEERDAQALQVYLDGDIPF